MKKLFLFILMLLPFVVKAEENLNYDWSKEVIGVSYFMYADDEEITLGETSDTKFGPTTYNYNGKKTGHINFETWETMHSDPKFINKVLATTRPYYGFQFETEEDMGFMEYTGRVYICEKEYFGSGDKCYERFLEDMTDDDIVDMMGDYYWLYKKMYQSEDVIYDFIVRNHKKIILINKIDGRNDKYRIELYDEEDELVFSKTLVCEDGWIYADFDDNNIWVLSSENNESMIIKMNYKGDIVYQEKLVNIIPDSEKNNEEFNNLSIGIVDGGLIVTVALGEGGRNGYWTDGHYPEDDYYEMYDDYFADVTTKIIKLSFSYNVDVKTNGYGNIEVVETSKPGEGVTFAVTPKTGYVLGSVKVIDANGNVLVFTSNTFTMPNADVTIEAEFIKDVKNPYTSSFGLLGVLIVSCISAVLFINFKKKYLFLK